MRRKNIVAGNWKMNKTLNETKDLIADILEETNSGRAEVIVAPTFTNLQEAVVNFRNSGSKIQVAAQNMYQAPSGAYTGEISAGMLKSIGVETVILGHSERRAYFGEDSKILFEKVTAALENGMRVIFCFGEELADRKTGNHFKLVASQLEEVVFKLDAASWGNIVLAYEPVWAIGTGETASPEQAQEMHAFIRKQLAQQYDQTLADGVSILYGGSVKPANATNIFSNPDVDGGLIGGASLKAKDFFAIVNAF